MATITWFGHSAFKITSNSKNVLIDPFLAFSKKYNAENCGEADLILVTHDHGDHVGDTVAIAKRTGASVGAVVGTAGKLGESGVTSDKILNGIGFGIGGTLECAGFKCTLTPALHLTDSGMPVGYIIKTPDGKNIYHAGDTCVFGDMALWGSLYSIDVALLPIGGTFTMDARQAAEACKLLKAKAVIPMHWASFPVLAKDTSEFESELQKRAPQCKFLKLDVDNSLEV